MAFTPASLDAELRTAAASDLRHRRVDDMKKRAIISARSYDEFRHLVACAETDQKPLNQHDLAYLSGAANPSPRHGFSREKAVGKQRFLFGEKEDGEKMDAARAALAQGLLPGNVRSYAEFARVWRRCGGGAEERVKVLFGLRKERFGRVFGGEMSEFGEMMIAIREMMRMAGDEVERRKVAELLEALAGVKAFGLAVKFLSREEKEAVKEVVEWVEAGEPERSRGLRERYKPAL